MSHRDFMRPRMRIFSRERNSWLAAILYLILLYSTLTIAFDLYVSIYDQVGRATVSFWINGLFVITGAALLLLLILTFRPDATGYVALFLIAATIAFSLHILEVPAKRFHFFQYAPLTLFFFDALRHRLESPRIYVWTMLLVGLAGLGDETLQGLLPKRHFGISDVFLNATAGLVTLAFLGFVLRVRVER